MATDNSRLLPMPILGRTRRPRSCGARPDTESGVIRPLRRRLEPRIDQRALLAVCLRTAASARERSDGEDARLPASTFRRWMVATPEERPDARHRTALPHLVAAPRA